MSDVDKLLKLIVKTVDTLKGPELYEKFEKLTDAEKFKVITLAVSLCVTRPDLVDATLRLREEANIPDC